MRVVRVVLVTAADNTFLAGGATTPGLQTWRSEAITRTALQPHTMGRNEFATNLAASDSGYGDDVSDQNSSSSLHPLSRKGYEIGPASKLQIGDVFEFLWADCPEFEWEWKCLGYTRFMVLRHSDSFPRYCACVPISTGSNRDFAKPGVDTLQQGYVYASGDKDRDRDRASTEPPSQRHPSSRSLPELPYSSVGISLRGGRHRVRDDSRANYADIVEVAHAAQVMVVGDAARYFDRVRRNVNKACMRQILRDALRPYCQRRKTESAAAGLGGWGNSAASLVRAPGGADNEPGDKPAAEEDWEAREAREAAPGLVRLEHVHVPEETPAAADRDMEDFLSDSTQDEEDSEGSPPSPAAFPKSALAPPTCDERRACPVPEHTTAVRPGMDKAGLSSLRSLRQRLPGGNEHDDTQSLRSLAMQSSTLAIPTSTNSCAWYETLQKRQKASCWSPGRFGLSTPKVAQDWSCFVCANLLLGSAHTHPEGADSVHRTNAEADHLPSPPTLGRIPRRRRALLKPTFHSFTEGSGRARRLRCRLCDCSGPSRPPGDRAKSGEEPSPVECSGPGGQQMEPRSWAAYASGPERRGQPGMKSGVHQQPGWHAAGPWMKKEGKAPGPEENALYIYIYLDATAPRDFSHTHTPLGAGQKSPSPASSVLVF